ncbi:hypothetical protein [Curtobacterium sp. MCSS17_016]|uniref:hypothetical protein n=1 Tax=Curtobacterium sp. MCSS17_016 TaxID=2175644 RepID=UPI000DA78752|nr:hypothetical protein [Curtobacterium sp. MCSS17_016]WIE81107.1 hypothetical protein DEJ19_021770 [Curtobacterium sp. MCSS17_016]
MSSTHPIAVAAKRLSRTANRRAALWGVAVLLLVGGIVSLGAYTVQSTWVSETTANADTASYYRNQSMKSDAKLLQTDDAKQLIASTEESYGPQWNTFIDYLTVKQDEAAKRDHAAANKVADGLIFPNLRAQYRAWAAERAESQPSITVKQQAQLQVLAVYTQTCRDRWQGHDQAYTLATFAKDFDAADVGILELRATELGDDLCDG